MLPCVNKCAACCETNIFTLSISHCRENFTDKWPNVGLHVTVKNKSCCKASSAVQFVSSHFAD